MRDLKLIPPQFAPPMERLAPSDARFLNIADLAQGGSYTEAADAVAALLADNLYEVRLLSFYLFAAVHEDGLTRLPEVIGTQAALIRQNWAALPPEDKQAALVNKGVVWLFRTLLDVLAYHQTKKDDRWQGWLGELTEAHVTQSLQKAEELLTLLPEPTYHSSAELVTRLVQWLRELLPVLAAARVPPAQAEPLRGAPQAPPPQALQDASSTFLRLGQLVQLRGSAHFVELCNKLKAFELLVQERDYEKAALVSDDILATLDGFDPRRYFPELFATFGALLHKHVQEIQPHWERKDSPEWKTLSQFYQVDLESFVTPKD